MLTRLRPLVAMAERRRGAGTTDRGGDAVAPAAAEHLAWGLGGG
jgi:hypothetical protein